MVVVWQHYHERKFYFDNIYAQRVDPTGNTRWGEHGVAICTAPGLEQSISLVEDGQGGVVAVWQDERDIYPDLYAQRISGVPVCTAEGHQILPALVKSGRDRFFVSWRDYREDYGIQQQDSIYGQKLNLARKGLWTENGIQLPVQQQKGLAWTPVVVGHPSGQVDLVWSYSGDIYLHRLR